MTKFSIGSSLLLEEESELFELQSSTIAIVAKGLFLFGVDLVVA